MLIFKLLLIVYILVCLWTFLEILNALRQAEDVKLNMFLFSILLSVVPAVNIAIIGAIYEDEEVKPLLKNPLKKMNFVVFKKKN